MPADVLCHFLCAGTTIGKRYARTDELGVPYDITVDRASIDGDGSVTLRERDSTSQVRTSPIARSSYKVSPLKF